jgi:hypothetical protein
MIRLLAAGNGLYRVKGIRTQMDAREEQSVRSVHYGRSQKPNKAIRTSQERHGEEACSNRAGTIT